MGGGVVDTGLSFTLVMDDTVVPNFISYNLTVSHNKINYTYSHASDNVWNNISYSESDLLQLNSLSAEASSIAIEFYNSSSNGLGMTYVPSGDSIRIMPTTAKIVVYLSGQRPEPV
jgi:hypothetical protein